MFGRTTTRRRACARATILWAPPVPLAARLLDLAGGGARRPRHPARCSRTNCAIRADGDHHDGGEIAERRPFLLRRDYHQRSKWKRTTWGNETVVGTGRELAPVGMARRGELVGAARGARAGALRATSPASPAWRSAPPGPASAAVLAFRATGSASRHPPAFCCEKGREEWRRLPSHLLDVYLTRGVRGECVKAATVAPFRTPPSGHRPLCTLCNTVLSSATEIGERKTQRPRGASRGGQPRSPLSQNGRGGESCAVGRSAAASSLVPTRHTRTATAGSTPSHDDRQPPSPRGGPAPGGGGFARLASLASFAACRTLAPEEL